MRPRTDALTARTLSGRHDRTDAVSPSPRFDDPEGISYWSKCRLQMAKMQITKDEAPARQAER